MYVGLSTFHREISEDSFLFLKKKKKTCSFYSYTCDQRELITSIFLLRYLVNSFCSPTTTVWIWAVIAQFCS